MEGTSPTWRDSSACNIGSTVVVFGGRIGTSYSDRVCILQCEQRPIVDKNEKVEEEEEEKKEKEKKEGGEREVWRWEDVTDKITGDRPAPRASHAAGVVGRKLFIFGGDGGTVDQKQQPLNDIHVLDLGTSFLLAVWAGWGGGRERLTNNISKK